MRSDGDEGGGRGGGDDYDDDGVGDRDGGGMRYGMTCDGMGLDRILCRERRRLDLPPHAVLVATSRAIAGWRYRL